MGEQVLATPSIRQASRRIKHRRIVADNPGTALGVLSGGTLDPQPVTYRKSHQPPIVPRYWTCHWRNEYWHPEHNPEGEALTVSGSNKFLARGVKKGDVVYVVSILDGKLLLGGRMTVEQIVSREKAIEPTKIQDLYDSAAEWVLGDGSQGTPIHLHRRLAPVITRKIRFVTKEGLKPPFFPGESDDLDAQTTRGVRELWHRSAELLDEILAATDSVTANRKWITVTEKTLAGARARLS